MMEEGLFTTLCLMLCQGKNDSPTVGPFHYPSRSPSLPPEKGTQSESFISERGHRVGTHSLSGFPKWGVGPSLQAPLKPFWLLSVQDKKLLTCQYPTGRDLLLSFKINFRVEIL